MSLESMYTGGPHDFNPSIFNGQTVMNVDTSNLNIDYTPRNYDQRGYFVRNTDTSQLNLDVIPPLYDPQARRRR